MEVAETATPRRSSGLRRACATPARPPRNLGWAVDRVRDAALAAGPDGMAAAARAEAEAIHAEEDAASARMAAHGADLLAGARRVLTHCNTGALAAGGRGTALGVILELADRGDGARARERDAPPAPGRRLTVWELRRAGDRARAARRRRGRRADRARRGRRRGRRAATGSPRTATSRTRSAPTRSRWPRAPPASRSSSPGPTSSIDAALDTGAGDPDRGARRRRGPPRRRRAADRRRDARAATRRST